MPGEYKRETSGENWLDWGVVRNEKVKQFCESANLTDAQNEQLISKWMPMDVPTDGGPVGHGPNSA